MTLATIFNPEFCIRLTWTLAHFLWQGIAIALLAILAASLLRKITANMRYWLFVAPLAGMALCLPLTFLFQTSRQPLPQNNPSATEASFSTPPAPIVATPNITPAIQTTSVAPATLAPNNSSLVAPTPQMGNTPALSTPPPPSLKKRIIALANSNFSESIAPWVTSGYFLGTFLILLRLLLALRGGYGLRRLSQPITEPYVLTSLERAAQAVRLRIVPAAAWCERVAVPCVVGIVKPVVLLPFSISTNLSTEQIEMLLLHELAHLRRYDHWVNLAQWLIETVLFFHPAVWYISHRIRVEREIACDDMVVASGVEQDHYAESLLRMVEISRDVQRTKQLEAIALGSSGPRRSTPAHRILRLIEGNVILERFRPIRVWPVGITLTLLFVAMLGMVIEFCMNTLYPPPQLRLAAWSMIVDDPLAQELLKQGIEKPDIKLDGVRVNKKDTSYKSYNFNSNILTNILKNGYQNETVLCNTFIQWPSHDNKSNYEEPINFGGGDPYNTYYPLERKGGIWTSFWYKMSKGKNAIQFEALGGRTNTAWIDHRDTIADHDPELGHQAEISGGISSSLTTIKSGESLVWMVPMGQSKQYSPWHLIILQAIKIPNAVAISHPENIQNAAQWIKNGPQKTLEQYQQAVNWAKNTQAQSQSNATNWEHKIPSSGTLRLVAIGQPSHWRWWNGNGEAVGIKNTIFGNAFGLPYTAPENMLQILMEGLNIQDQLHFQLRLPSGKTFNCNQWNSDLFKSQKTNPLQILIDPRWTKSLGWNREEEDQQQLRKWMATPTPFDIIVYYPGGSVEDIGSIRPEETKEINGEKFSMGKIETTGNGEKTKSRVSVYFSAYTDSTFALVPVDKQGKKLKSPAFCFSSLDGNFTRKKELETFPRGYEIDTPPAQIDHFIIQRRPVASYTFANIPSAPQHVPNTDIAESNSVPLSQNGPVNTTSSTLTQTTTTTIVSAPEYTESPKPGEVMFNLKYMGLDEPLCHRVETTGRNVYMPPNPQTRFTKSLNLKAPEIIYSPVPFLKDSPLFAVECDENAKATAAYIDLNCNGILDEGEKLLPCSSHISEPLPKLTCHVYFLTPDFTIHQDGKTYPYRLLITANTWDKKCYIGVKAACILQGTAILNGKERRFILMDSETGRNDYAKFGPTGSSPTNYTIAPIQPDGKFDFPGRENLSKIIRVDDKNYDVRFSANKQQVFLKAQDRPSGSITITVTGNTPQETEISSSVCLSEANDPDLFFEITSPEENESTKLPIGNYKIIAGNFSYAQQESSTEATDSWNCRFTCPREFSITPNEQVCLNFGSPQLSIDCKRATNKYRDGTVVSNYNKGDIIHLSCIVKGKQNETYLHFARENYFSPTFQILDATQTIITSGTMGRLGSDSTGALNWNTKNMQPGEYTIVMQQETGPLAGKLEGRASICIQGDKTEKQSPSQAGEKISFTNAATVQLVGISDSPTAQECYTPLGIRMPSTPKGYETASEKYVAAPQNAALVPRQFFIELQNLPLEKEKPAIRWKLENSSGVLGSYASNRDNSLRLNFFGMTAPNQKTATLHLGLATGRCQTGYSASVDRRTENGINRDISSKKRVVFGKPSFQNGKYTATIYSAQPELDCMVEVDDKDGRKYSGTLLQETAAPYPNYSQATYEFPSVTPEIQIERIQAEVRYYEWCEIRNIQLNAATNKAQPADAEIVPQLVQQLGDI